MSVNSLSNFGTPGMAGERGAALQPIFANRFRALFFNFGSTGEVAPYDLTRQTKSVGLPEIDFEKQTLYTYSQPTYVVNRGEWKEVTIKFHSDITNTVLRRIENQFAKQQNFFDQTYSRAGENYKFDFDLDILAGGASAGAFADPNIIQKWSYAGCMLIGRTYGEMNVEEQKAMEIAVTVVFDNCIGFDQNGRRMGDFSHFAEIAGQLGVLSTLGVSSGTGISISGASVSLGGSFGNGGSFSAGISF